MQVAFSSAFKRAFKKLTRRQPSLDGAFWARLEIFIEDPFDPRLRTHKLTGDLKGLWSFSLRHDQRVVFFFAEKDSAVLLDIGDHDAVY